MKLFALAFAFSIAALAACTKPVGAGPNAERTSTCTKEGAPCTFAEGKIGLCNATSATTTCDGGPCLTCMSLH